MGKLIQKLEKLKESISGKGHSYKIRKIVTGLRVLNLAPEKILIHSQRRKIMFFS